MTNPQSNNDTNLNHIDLSLNEFLGAPWKDKKNSQTNIEAMKMLLMPTDEAEQSRELSDSKFIRRKDRQTDISLKTALESANQTKNYLLLAKLNYSYLWYSLRVSLAIGSGIVEETLATTWALAKFLATPAHLFLDFFFEDSYRRFRENSKAILDEKRFLLGRGRANSFLSGVIHRSSYMMSYIRVHQFNYIAQLLGRSLTIRRGIQTILPLTIGYLIVQRTTVNPNTVYSKGLEKTSKQLTATPITLERKLNFLDNLNPGLNVAHEFARDDQGVLFTRYSGLIRQFVGGEYTDVEKVSFRDITHPLEFFEIINKDKHGKVLQHKFNLGVYEWSEDEMKQIPVWNGDDETEPPPFVMPDTLPERIAQQDNQLVTKYRESVKTNNVIKQTANEKQLTQRGNTIASRYMPMRPTIGQLPEQDYLTTDDYEPVKNNTDTVDPSRVSPRLLILHWDRDLKQLEFFHKQVFGNTKGAKKVFKFNEEQENRFVFSPFGITYSTNQTNPTKLEPFSRNETKLFHYALPNMQETVETFELRKRDTRFLEFESYRNFLKNELEQIVTYHQIPLFEQEFEDDEDNNIESGNGDNGTLHEFNIETNEVSNSNLNTNNNTVGPAPEPAFFTEYTKPLWFADGTLFLNPTQYQQWKDVVWTGMVFHIFMYVGIEMAIRLEGRGLIYRRVKPLPQVNRLISHLARMPEGVKSVDYIGEKMNTAPVQKILLAFQAKRGTQLYGSSEWGRFWNRLIRPNLSAQQAETIRHTVQRIQKNTMQTIGLNPSDQFQSVSRNVLEHTSLLSSNVQKVPPRYFMFDKVTNKLQEYLERDSSSTNTLTSQALQQQQTRFNNLGGELNIIDGFKYAKTLQSEMCNLPLLALIKPGTERMNRLPKGMILLGEPGNGRTYFVRALATESRLPLLITESNRYLHESQGLVRLKTLFKRARNQAPNILFIRDLDFMTRHRERYPMFASVRATTHLLLAIDGYSRGTETIPAQQDIFIIGSMSTTSMMDDACMRSGRFEWVLHFHYPPVYERYDMLLLHSTKSIVNKSMGVDWKYLTAMTQGFSCLDLRTLINTSAIYTLKNQETMHTNDSIAFALGFVNQIHDLPNATFIDPMNLGFFSTFDFKARHNQPLQYAPFFTQTGQIPMYKKLMHLFRLMIPKETNNLASAWNNHKVDPGIETIRDPHLTVSDGLVALLCEGLFLYNIQKSFGQYPIVTFESYCSPLFLQTQELVNKVSGQYLLERLTKEHLFITTFDLWRRTHPETWVPTGLYKNKTINMRVDSTALWRTNRFSKDYPLIAGLTEVQCETLWGPPPIADKIRQRLGFISKKGNEFVSSDVNIFGTFETNNDLSFKCRKESTARRVDQVAMELVDVMQKNWRHS